MTSYVMKKITYAILIIGIIGSFIGGAVFKTYNLEKQEFSYNGELVITGIISTLVLFIIMLALSTIIEKLEYLAVAEYKKSLNKNTKAQEEPEKKKSKYKWRCTNCGNLNDISDWSCANCESVKVDNSSVRKICLECYYDNEQNATKCSHCGNDL